MNNSYTMFILTSGRHGYLDRTIMSWELNLLDQPKYKIIFDDSGDERFYQYLQKKYSDRFLIVKIDKDQVGQKRAVQFIFDYVSKLDAQYVLELEEDWILFRPIKINDVISVLEKNTHLVQIRIPRTAWHSSYHDLDIKYGSILNFDIQQPKSTCYFVEQDGLAWYELRGQSYFWSHNPCVYNKSVMDHTYYQEEDQDHEYSFGEKLLKDPNAFSGFFAKNIFDAYVCHIGIRDNVLINSIKDNNFIAKQYEHRKR